MTTYAIFNVDSSDSNTGTSSASLKWATLQIGGNAVRFLNAVLLDRTVFQIARITATHCRWKLVFFRGNPCETAIEINLHDVRPTSVALHSAGKAIWSEFEATREKPRLVDVTDASQWLRETNTLGLDDFHLEAGRYVAVDSKGIAFYSDPKQESTFLRALILQALGYAYLHVLSNLSKEIAASLGDAGSMRAAYKKLIMFNAQCFLTYPVGPDNTTLPGIWDRLRDKFKLDRVNEELTRQAHDVANLLAEQARQDEEQRQHDLQTRSDQAKAAASEQQHRADAAERKRLLLLKWLGGFVSVALAGVSILQGLQAPPAQLLENFRLWRMLFF